jgi:lipopolysaccharide export system permease protein
LTRRSVPPTTFWLVFWGLLEPFMLVMAAFTLVHLLADAADQFNNITANDAALAGVEYLVLRIPFIVTKLMPVSLLAGVMFGFAMMNRSREVVAMQALGISRLQIAFPLVLIAAAATIFDFAVSETIVPATNRRAELVLTKRIGARRHEPSTGNETWVRTRNAFIVAEAYNSSRKQLRDLTIFRFDSSSELSIVTQVDSATWNGQNWHFRNVRSIYVGAPDQSGKDQDVDLDLTPSDLEAPVAASPDDFSLAELNGFIRALQRVGLNAQRYIADRDLKYAMPVSCLILAAIGFALSLDPLPRQGGFARNIGSALAAGFGYWLVLGFTMSFGKSGVLSPWPAAWLPNILFGSIAVSMFLMGEEK